MLVFLLLVIEYFWVCYCFLVNGGRSLKINVGCWGWWLSRIYRFIYLIFCLSEIGEGREDYDIVCLFWKFLVWCLISLLELSCRKGFYGILVWDFEKVFMRIREWGRGWDLRDKKRMVLEIVWIEVLVFFFFRF